MAQDVKEMRGWLTAVEQQDGHYVVFRQDPARETEWYVAVLAYPPSFRPAPASVTTPPAGVNWYGPFGSREAARQAAAHAISQGCVTPIPFP